MSTTSQAARKGWLSRVSPGRRLDRSIACKAVIAGAPGLRLAKVAIRSMTPAALNIGRHSSWNRIDLPRRRVTVSFQPFQLKIIWRFAVKWIVFHPGLVQRLAVAMVLLVTFCLIAQGQTWTQYDQGTPPQHAAGVSPLGSYLSTDLGTVSL